MADTRRFPFVAKIKAPSNDKGGHKQARFTADGHEFTAKIVDSYGVQGAPITDGEALIIPVEGDMSRCYAFVLPPEKDRVDQQKEGEASYKNHKTGGVIKHDASGTTTHEAPGDIILKSGGTVHINP